MNKNKKLKELQDKENYNVYQEDLGFEKELNILRNDFYYQMIYSRNISLVDFMYNPLDVMSGDAYSARRIDEHCTFYLMVDGMGKGMSASLTAMIMTSFVNHIFDKMIAHDSFDLSILVHETMEYIKPILLEEEALAIDYIVINNDENMMYYAKFGMPVLLMENDNNKIAKIVSNNAPLSKYQKTFNVSGYDITNITKFLIYTDGIVENTTIHDNKLYSDFIEEDFLNSFTRADLKKSFFDKIDIQEDDVTLIFINNLHHKTSNVTSMYFSSELESVDKANDWYSSILEKISSDNTAKYNANIVFTELFMNAYEHGSLGIDSELKQQLLDEDIYFETLNEKSQSCKKEIKVIVSEVLFNSQNYVITQIIDEGEGFDTQILSQIFRNSQAFNGRGVFVSRKNSLGIYYNSKGNSVLYLNKI
ncbi:PP2C family protein-serine/threonine phosphatase [Sulfurimonas sp.]